MAVSAQTTLLLKTDDYPNGLKLSVGPWRRDTATNPGPEYWGQTDWSGGINQKIIPKERTATNMVWKGNAWTALPYEIYAGPLLTAPTGAVTASKVWGFQEFGNNNTLYFCMGADVYSYVKASETPTISDDQTVTLTDLKEVEDMLVACRGTNTLVREKGSGDWGNGVYRADCVTYSKDKKYWASNATGTGTATASYLWWGATTALSQRISKENMPITQLVDVKGELLIFKRDAVFAWIPGTGTTSNRFLRIMNLPHNAGNGVAHCEYNGALYFAGGQGLWCWRGQGPAEPVPLPEMTDPAQIGRVYCLHTMDNAMLVGFKGDCFAVFEDPPQSSNYWWHYLMDNSGAQFTGAWLSTQLGLTRPRIFFGFNSDSTSTIQYIELIAENFMPYTFETGTQVIFPGIYSGPELDPMWVKNIVCGTHGCADAKTIQFAYSTDLSTWTDFGSPVTTNGFHSITPSANVSGRMIWFRATFATTTTTASPVLDFFRVYYRVRTPALRQWTFPIVAIQRGRHPTGGMQMAPDDTLQELFDARNQTNPSTLTFKPENLTDLPVFVDVRAEQQRVNAKQGEVTRAVYYMIASEA